MSFSVNDPFLYLLSAIIVVFVVAQSVFFLVKANRRAQQMGIAAATVRKDHPLQRAVFHRAGHFHSGGRDHAEQLHRPAVPVAEAERAGRGHL